MLIYVCNLQCTMYNVQRTAYNLPTWKLKAKSVFVGFILRIQCSSVENGREKRLGSGSGRK